MKVIIKWTHISILLFGITLLYGQKEGLNRVYIESLKQQMASSLEDTNRAMLLGKLSSEYVWFDADSGIVFAESGLTFSKKINFKYGEAISSYNLCIGLNQKGNYINALDFGFKALSIFESLHDLVNIRLSHAVLMICYRDQGDYQQALIHGYKAKESGQMPLLDSIIILSNISSVYEKSNKLDSALFYGQKVYQLDEQDIPELITLGNIYSKKGEFGTALNFYEKGIGRATTWSLMDLCLGIAKVYKLNNQIDSSINFAKKSLLVGQNIDNPLGMHDASKLLSMLYEVKNRPDSVVKYLKLAVSLNDSLFNNQKTRDAQSFAFNETLHLQELETRQVQYLNKFRIYGLLSILIFTLLIAFIQYRNNKRKHHANIQLQQQKEKVESTLTELKATQSQLIQSEKMASLGELTAGIAHEIQNPLNFVNNFSEVNNELINEMKEELAIGNEQYAIGNQQSAKKKLETAMEIAEDIKQNLEKINHHGKRAESIVKGMLQHSRKSTGIKEPTDINALADEYMRLSYYGLRAKDKGFNAEYKMDFDPTLPLLKVIPQDIGRVLLNLFNNAFWATNERKNGEMEKRRTESADSVSGLPFSPSVTLTTKNLGDHIEIRIHDNGPGIPPHIIDKIFQPFFTTKPTGQGTGLGLSLAYDIIKAHGGEMNVKTEVGKGSEFIIQMPVI